MKEAAVVVLVVVMIAAARVMMLVGLSEITVMAIMHIITMALV